MDKEDILGNGWKRWDIFIFIISHFNGILVYSSVVWHWQYDVSVILVSNG